MENLKLPCFCAPEDSVELEAVKKSGLGKHLVVSIATEELPANASTPMIYLTVDNAKALYVWLWYAIKEIEGSGNAP